MARKIIWSFEATADLEAIADYIARDSSFYAASFVIEVREASRLSVNFSLKIIVLFIALKNLVLIFWVLFMGEET